MLTRKHFIEIALLLSKHRTRIIADEGMDFWVRHGCLTANEELARDMADFLATTNPHFDRQRFLTAAGLDLSKMKF